MLKMETSGIEHTAQRRQPESNIPNLTMFIL